MTSYDASGRFRTSIRHKTALFYDDNSALNSQTANTRKQHRQEVAILCVDCSPSMNTRDFGSQTRIEAVRDAIQSLLAYKGRVIAAR